MDRYAARPDAYVGSDMLWYWVEGNIEKRASPDVFVAFGPCKAPERRVWKVWEEGVAADFVLEVTSRSTRRKDEGFKAELYEKLGVKEYWQFDPTGDYLRPNLKGRRLGADGAYGAIPLEERDGVPWGWSEALGLELRPEGEALRLYDPVLGEYLPARVEKTRIIERAKAERDAAAAERDAVKAKLDETAAQRDAAAAQLDAATAERDAEAAARRAAEAQIAELKRQLAEGGE